MKHIQAALAFVGMIAAGFAATNGCAVGVDLTSPDDFDAGSSAGGAPTGAGGGTAMSGGSGGSSAGSNATGSGGTGGAGTGGDGSGVGGMGGGALVDAGMGAGGTGGGGGAGGMGVGGMGGAGMSGAGGTPSPDAGTRDAEAGVPANSDLIVTAVTWSPANVVSGQAATFSATIKNQGAGATPAAIIVRVGFSVDGTLVTWSDTNVKALAPNATATLVASAGTSGATWNATAGTHKVEAFVDDLNRITETDESNNKLSATLIVGSTGIDVTVTAITSAPATPANGNAVTFSAVVKNLGTVGTPNGTILGVGFSVDGTQVSFSDSMTTSLGAGQTVTLTANGGPAGSNKWTATSGAHMVQAWVDDVSRFTDSDRTNNKLVIPLNVP